MKHNLILTMVHRIKYPALEPFFRSLQRTDFHGDVVVFASLLRAESIRQLRQWGAHVVPFFFPGEHVVNRASQLWWIWKKVFASDISQRGKERLAHVVFHLFYRRHLLYLDFLRERGSQYDSVFLTDCRDVFFQANPFSWNAAPGLHVFLEEDSNTIGLCPHNSRWMRNLFGEEALRLLAGETVSCAGTVFGDVPAIMDYLQLMIASAMQVPSMRDADGDQGIHNYLLRTGRLGSVKIHSNRKGPVMTAGLMKPTDLRRNANGLVMNEANEVVPTLHQYDRIPELLNAFRSPFR